jgi:hypothetical protein
MNFPDTPTNGATFTSGGSTWTWFTTPGAWKAATASGGVANLYLPLTGGTLSGLLTAPLGLRASGSAFNLGNTPTWALLNTAFNTLANSGSMGIGWNYSNGGGETSFFINRGGGNTGGLIIYDFPNTSGTPTPLLALNGVGGLVLGAANMQAPQQIQPGSIMASVLTTLGATGLFNNVYNDTSGNNHLIANAMATAMNNSSGNFGFYRAAAAAVGSAPVWIQSVGIGTVGNLAVYCDQNYALQISNQAGTTNILKISGSNTIDPAWPSIRSDGNNLVLNPKSGGEIYLSYDVTSGFVCVGSTTNNVNDPLEIHTPTTNYCRVRYYTSRTWSAGAFGSSGGAAAGMFGIADESGGKVELILGYSGQWHKTYEHWMAGADNTYWCGYTGVAWYGVMSYSFPAPSDAKYKTDFADLPTCLDLVQAISPQRYRFHSAPAEERHRVHWGFVAQDVEAVMAQRGHDFSGGHRIDNGNHALCYNDLIAVLWKALQELTEEVASLKKGMA